jgi:PAS domain S-box-containing protein
MNNVEKIGTSILRRLPGYLVAVGAVALATWLKYLAQPKIIPADVPILYLLAIVPTAIFFGLGPSLTVCVLSFLAYDYYFLPPVHQLNLNIDQTPIMVIFLLVGVLFSYLASNLRRQNQVAIKENAARKQSEAELMKYRDHLEELVQQRTAELEKANLQLKDEISDHRKDEEDLRQNEERWSTTLASIGDGVIATDVSGKVTFMNTVAQELTGWKLAEVNQKPVSEVFNIISETTRQKAENPVDKVLQLGNICGLANHTILIRKDGTEISIDDSGAPIKDIKDVTTGVVLVFRDITERRKTEIMLRRVEERNRLLADILEHASQPFGIGLPDGSLGIVNKAFCDLTGYTSEELKTMDWAKVLTPPEYLTMEAEKLAELVRTGQPVRYEKEYIKKDKSRVPIELLVNLARNPDGQVEYYYSFLTDITERKKAEAALQQSENKYRSLFENMSEGFALCEMIYDTGGKPIDYRFIDVNPVMEKFVGLPKNMIVGNTIRSITPNVQSKAIENFGRVALSGEHIHFENFSRDLNRWFDVYAYQAKPGQFGFMTLDIDSRKRAEKDLEENRQNFITIAETVTTGIGVIGMSDGKFVYVNSAYEKGFGYAPGELMGQPTPDIYWDIKDRTNILELLKKTGNKADYDVRLKKKDGTMFWGMASVRPITFNGNPALLGVFTDISERKQAEEAIQNTLNRFYTVLSEMPMGVLLVTEAGMVEFANQAFCDIFEIKEHPTDLRNRTSPEIIAMIKKAYVSPEKAIARITEILAGGKPVKDEDVPMRGGRTVLRDYVPVHMGENIHGRLWLHRDITERKKVEDALEESEAKANALIKYAPTGIYEIDYRKQLFVSINDAMSSLSGYSKEELFTLGPGALLDEDSKKLFASRIRRQLAGEKIDDSVEYRVKKKDGSLLWVTLNIAFSNDNPDIALVIGHDITERKQAEIEKSRMSLQRQLALDAAQMGWWQYDPATEIATYDEGYKRIFGVSGSQRPNDEILKRLHPEDLPRVWASVEAALNAADPQPYSAEYRILLDDGSVRWIEAHGTATFEGEGAGRRATSLIGTVADITDRVLAGEKLKESEEKFSKAFHSSPVGMVITNLADGRWIDTNNTYLKMLEYTREEVIGRTASEINLYPEPAQRIQILQTLKDEGEVKGIEVRLRAKSGHIIETLSSVSRINIQGQVCTISTIIDITQRKQAEAEINRLNRELKAINECDQVIVHANDEQKFLSEICKVLCTTGGYQMAWISSVEHDEAKSVRPLAWCGDEGYIAKANITWADSERGQGPAGLAIRTGRTHFFQDFTTDQAAAPWREMALSLGYLSSIAVPLKDTAGNVFALFSLYSSEVNHFNPAEVRLLEELGADISFGIAALREMEKRHQAEAEVIHLASFPELNPNPVIELDAAGTVKYANRAAKEEFPLVMQGQKQTYIAELIRSIRRDKTPTITRDVNINNLWFEQTLAYVPSTDSYLLYGRNITARKEAEEGLRESEEKFSKAFHSSPVGLVITHLPDGTWVDANETYLKMLGYTREEVIGCTSSDLNLYPDANKRAEIFRVLREEGKISNFELRLRTKTGKIIDTLSSVEMLNLHNEEFSLSTNMDITERKKAEDELKQRTIDLEASNKELEAFSYSVSHDLRAPLRSITGFSNVLLEDYNDELDKEGKSYLKKISDSGELMGQLMDDLLKLSRVTRSELNFEKINLSDMAHKVVSELRKDEPDRKVKVTIAPNMTAQGDKNLMGLVLQNLLGNALKYSSKTAEPRIEMGKAEHNGKQAYFVRDNGVGFDMTYANKLFQPFQRLHKATEFEGTGIGLATVQRIIRRHGGEVWAESKVGEGATFYFTLN